VTAALPIGPHAAQQDLVVLVDAEDRSLGVCPKFEAHHGAGRRHRAFSLFVTDGRGRWLLQQRAWSKYHFAGRWSNTCCSHPRPGEGVVDAARRRLREELAMSARDYQVLGRFEYRAEDPTSGRVEHEIDHVVIATALGPARPDPTEVAAVRWLELAELRSAMAADPTSFTPWLALVLAELHTTGPADRIPA